MKILFCGDGGVATGFARVNQSIIENLPDDWEIHHLAVNYNGDPYKTKPNHFMYPARLGGDLLGYNRIKGLISAIKPDIIFILNDPWVIYDYLRIITTDQKVVAYTPVDAKPLDPVWVSAIKNVNQLITYTEFGKSAFTDKYPDFNDIIVIPHGTDHSKFYPLDKIECRKELGLPEDCFIVLNASRNQPRKRVDLTIKSFAEFAKDKPENVLLYLHMGLVDSGWNIEKLAARYKIADRLIITSKELSPAAYVSDEKLNVIYNCADVGINTSMGEGWSLTNSEHACCKVPQIVPNYSATAEIFSDSMALKIDVERFEPHLGILTEGCIVSIDSAAQHMESYYNNPELRKIHAENAYNKFTQESLSWKSIAKQFQQVFERVYNEEPKLKQTPPEE